MKLIIENIKSVGYGVIFFFKINRTFLLIIIFLLFLLQMVREIRNYAFPH